MSNPARKLAMHSEEEQLAPFAVVLSCHGSVDLLEDIPAFLSNIRRGRPAPSELIDEVTRRFQTIGGSPLMRISETQRALLEQRIRRPVYLASRLWHPYPEEVLEKVASDGIKRVFSLPLAPLSVHVYNECIEKAAKEKSMDVRGALPWFQNTQLIACQHRLIRETVYRLATSNPEEIPLVLTAHSLPMRVIEQGDPYAEHFQKMTEILRQTLSWEHVQLAYQSQGASSESWLGPTLNEAILQIARSGHRAVLVAPIGFVSDHVETLYDLDIEARAFARQCGIQTWVRVPAMNTDEMLMDCLENIVQTEAADWMSG